MIRERQSPPERRSLPHRPRLVPRLDPSVVPSAATALVLVAAFLLGAARYENFASWMVLRNLLVDNAYLGIAAVGATFVILAGGIDLSVGAVMAMTSVLVARLVEHAGVHPAVAIAVAILAGMSFGLAQGSLIQLFGLPAFLVTLAGMFLARGAAFALHPQSLGVRHPFVAQLLNDSLSLHIPLGPRGVVIPITVVVAGAVIAITWWTLRQTPFGRAVHAIGDDEHAATLMGVPVGRVRVMTYAIAGGLSALAGVAFTLYQQAGDPTACKGLELDAIAAVVIGGTLLRGGVGGVIGTLMGVLILGLIQTIITFEGDLSSWWTRIVVGVLVLAFVALQRGVDAIASRRLTSAA
ncbi:MAG: sugar ABC transporter permease YjfF [Phycisphaerae bacterium]|jgi:ribose/xylose/arabinose/galactoside ABC-type transport system permease subunit|nr:sugar ABC transporter permease YjfF [Phycisphaerae bacterium]